MDDTFPLDFESLRKGDVIPQEKIEKIYLCKRSEKPDEYPWKVVGLCEQIRSRRPDLEAHVCGRDNGIAILTDAEAENKTQSDIERAQQKIITTTKRRASIDRTHFDEQARRIAEYNDRQNQMVMMMNRKSLNERRREIALLASHNQTEPDESASK